MPAHRRDPALTPFQALLGAVPDQQIADLAGVSRALVVAYRKRLGVAAYTGHRNPPDQRPAAPADFRGRRSALDPFVDQLGRIPDAEIARLAGVTAENVRAYRARRGIPPASEAPVPSAETPAVPTPPRAPATAFLVGVDTREGPRNYVILAADIAEAARTADARVADRHPEATIRSIQRVAEVLP